MILSIETSCDDTAVACISSHGEVVFNQVFSQEYLHKTFGGVVPELASRGHLNKLNWLVEHSLKQTGLTQEKINAIAVCYAPGLLGALLVGVSYAKALAWAWNKPLITINHLEGHLLSACMTNPELDFPFLALLISGGHTQLCHVKQLGQYEVLGQTLDDAAGEAFDKTAKVLGLQYPGGPILNQIGKEYMEEINNKPNTAENEIAFPIPLKNSHSLDFSYSGLKTAVRNQAIAEGVFVAEGPLISKQQFDDLPPSPKKQKIKNIAHSFQNTVAEGLALRCRQALEQTGATKLAVCGGVAANSYVRQNLVIMAAEQEISIYFPSPIYCTDNAAMIGYAAYLRRQNGQEFKLDLAQEANPKSDF